MGQNTRVDRRQFLKGTAAMAAMAVPSPPFGLLEFRDRRDPSIEPFRVAYLSDSHLFAKGTTHRNARSMMRAIANINALDPRPDFVVFGGDLAQGGSRAELELGKEILAGLEAPVRMVVGEHDWYLDMGDSWRDLFGADHYSFDHRGVHFVALNNIHQRDFWTADGIDAKQRMAIAAGLDDVRQNPFEVGAEQLGWLRENLAGLDAAQPVVVLSHAPLYKLYRPWNFWTEDAEAVHALLDRFDRVSAIHGHTHQPLASRIGNLASFGMLSTSLAWPRVPQVHAELALELGPEPELSFDVGGCGVVEIGSEGHLANTWMRSTAEADTAAG